MSKISKITVKHYLNERLKPEIDGKIKIYPLYISITYDRMNVRTPSHIDNGTVTIITENDFLKNKIDKAILFQMDYETDLLKRCVENFRNDENLRQLNKNYLLKSEKKYRSKSERLNIFSSYLDFGTHSIYPVVADFLRSEIETEILKNIDKDLKELDLLDDYKAKLLFYPNNPNLYKLIVKYNLDYKYKIYFILWSRFHSYLAYQGKKYSYDMPYIDWIQGKGQTIFKEYLKQYTRSTDCWELDFFTEENIKTSISIIEKIIKNENYIEKKYKI